MRRLTLTLLATALLVAPSLASAQRTVAPPGNSGVDQYLETVPTAGGGKKAAPGGSGHKPSTPGLQRLAHLGADGQAAAAVAQASAPNAALQAGRNGSRGHGHGPGSQTQASSSSSSSQPSDVGSGGRAVLRAATGGGGGLGAGLPLILGAILIAALVTFAWRRSRANTG